VRVRIPPGALFTVLFLGRVGLFDAATQFGYSCASFVILSLEAI